MGLLDSLTKNPGLLGLAALGIGLFIFRDKISGFLSDITGGAQGTAQIAETGGILAKNLQSNLTLTPLPTDPIFGESGFFAGLGNFFNNLQLPKLPVTEVQPFTQGTKTDFTGSGMAGARARQDIEGLEVIARSPIDRILPQGVALADPPSIPFSVRNIEETQPQFQERSAAFVEAFPDITFSTSLPGADIAFGRQLSRNSEDFDRALAEEAARSESIFAALFGNVQNPNF